MFLIGDIIQMCVCVLMCVRACMCVLKSWIYYIICVVVYNYMVESVTVSVE